MVCKKFSRGTFSEDGIIRGVILRGRNSPRRIVWRRISHRGGTGFNSIQFQFIQIKLQYNTNNNKDPGSELVEDHNHKKLKMKKREKKKKKKKKRENMSN